ncbi:sperm-associated microtubule inner protein 10 isoform X2 [Phyllobates terribilis]|uniref:sperm-associated microtubule inner protein 10 isoform X2 n=1 Tax=Phyllobates terribilis TaxID=111132 RepID=UPI003CCAE0DF
MSEVCSPCDSVNSQKYRNPNKSIVISHEKQPTQDPSGLKEASEYKQNPGTMVSVSTITNIKGRHPIIPKRYVMSWKQDMVNRKLITRHADLAGLYRGPQEESLFLQNKERLCHGEEHHIIMEKIEIPSQHQRTDFPLHSPLSRYQSYMINQKTRMLRS